MVRFAMWPVSPKRCEERHQRCPRPRVGVIADVLRTDRARLMSWHPDGPLVQQMRAKIGLMLFLKRNIVRWTNRLRAVLLRYYPAATEIVGELTAQIALHFVQEFPTPEAAEALTWEDFVAFAQRHHYTHMRRLPDRFARLQRAQPSPNSVANLAYASEVTHLARLTLDMVQTERREQAALTALFEQHPDASLFRSLPGLGAFLAPAILTKFGEDRTRFSSPGSLQAVAGTCPITKSSGQHHAVHFRPACDRDFRWMTQQWATQRWGGGIGDQHQVTLGRGLLAHRSRTRSFRQLCVPMCRESLVSCGMESLAIASAL